MKIDCSILLLSPVGKFICQFFFSHIWFFVCVCFFQIRFIAMSAVTKTIYLIKKMRLSNSIVLFSWQKKAIPSRKVAELFSSNHRLIQNVAQLLFCCFFCLLNKSSWFTVIEQFLMKSTCANRLFACKPSSLQHAWHDAFHNGYIMCVKICPELVN